MTILGLLPTTPAPQITHPAWCDRTRCTVEPDLPLDDAVHLSRAVPADGGFTVSGPEDIDVWLHQGGASDDVYLVVDVIGTPVRAMFVLSAAATAVGAVTQLISQTSTEGARPVTTYTHPDVLTIGVRDGWADPQSDPTRIDWAPRQAAAAIAFEVVDGRPVNPCQRTGIRHGRGELGHWGEALAADAIVLADDNDGQRWLLMVEREDGHGWALPGGMVEPGEDPADAAVRELEEETGLRLPRADWHFDVASPVYVPDPRATDEAWIVSVACRTWVGRYSDPALLPSVAGGDDAKRAAWIRADSYDQLTGELARAYGGRVFAAHEQLLQHTLADRGDPFGCPNCGAPTGGNPCTNGPAGGPSCADVLAEEAASGHVTAL